MEATANQTSQEVVFSAKPDAGTIRLPADLVERIPIGQELRVVVTWETAQPTPAIAPVEYEDGTDEEWAKMGAYELARTADDEWNPEDLPEG